MSDTYITFDGDQTMNDFVNELFKYMAHDGVKAVINLPGQMRGYKLEIALLPLFDEDRVDH